MVIKLQFPNSKSQIMSKCQIPKIWNLKLVIWNLFDAWSLEFENYFLSLSLLVLGIITNNKNSAAAADNFAFFAHWFY